VSPVKVYDGAPTEPRLVAILVAEAAPRVGVTRVGLLDSTTEPVPVEVVTPVPPLTTGSTPDVICDAAIAIAVLVTLVA
jgi:hypothetical protein